MAMSYSRCGKDISRPSDYSMYVVKEAKDLCKECAAQFIQLTSRHEQERKDFLEEKSKEATST